MKLAQQLLSSTFVSVSRYMEGVRKMAKYAKAITHSYNPPIIECPYCGKVMVMFGESSETQRGTRRLRYRRIHLCPECEGKFLIEN